MLSRALELHSFVPDRLVDYLCYIDAIYIGYFPKTPNNIAETHKLISTNKIDSFTSESIYIISTGCYGQRNLVTARTRAYM
jgi:hypothetical protein